MSDSQQMKKHPTSWLLVLLLVLGAGQAVPLARVQRDRENFPIVQIATMRREKRVHRKRAFRVHAKQDPGVFASKDFIGVMRNIWSARFLRAPPFASPAV